MSYAQSVLEIILQHRLEFALFAVLLLIGLMALWTLLRWFSGARQPHPENYILRWHGVIEGLWAQPDEFYALLNTHLHEKVSQPESPFSKVKPLTRRLLARRSFGGALLGEKSTYLQTSYKHVSYYLCVCPAPIGLSVSSWAFTSRSEGETLYEHDTGTLFSLLMHQTMQDVLSLLCKHQSVPELSEDELAPIMRPFYAVSFSGRRNGLPNASSASGVLPDEPGGASPSASDIVAPETSGLAALPAEDPPKKSTP